MPAAAMPCGAPPNVAGPNAPPERPGRRARARAKAQAEGLNAKTVQDELFSSEKLTLPAKRLERGDVKKAVEVALREWPNKSQQEIAEQVGCSQFTVHSVQKELIAANMLTLPAKRMGKDGKERPTAYATRTTRTATSATFNPVLDGGATVNTPGAGPGRSCFQFGAGVFPAGALDIGRNIGATSWPGSARGRGAGMLRARPSVPAMPRPGPGPDRGAGGKLGL